MKRLLLVLFVLFPLAAFAAEKELKVGTECTYAPFTFRDANGVIQGFDVDIAREVAQRIGVEPVFVCNPFESSIPSLQARKFDILFTALSVTEERLKTVNFSLPYRSSTARFAGLKTLDVQLFDKDGKPNPAALKGKVIGLQRSSTYDKYVNDHFPGTTVQRYDTVNNMLLDLKAGRVDLVIAGPVNLWSTLLQKEGGDKYQFIGPEIENTDYFGIGIAAALRKDDTALLEQVNKAMQSMYDDGTFKKINLKYWPFTVLPSVWR